MTSPGPPSARAQAAALRLGASRLRWALALASLRLDAEPSDAAFCPVDGLWGAPPEGRAAQSDEPSAAPQPWDALLDDLLAAFGQRGPVPLAWLAWRLGRTLGRDRLARWTSRHPWHLVGAAALGGALVVGLRPWRSLGRPAVLLGLLMQLAAAARSRRPTPVAPVDPPAAGRWRRTTGPRPGVFR